ncbi:MAG: hypothetical protein ACR2RE_29510, partial [Geminicoccaceae bacterium]
MTAVETLPAPYDQPPAPDGVAPTAATVSLAEGQIDALLQQTPSFYALAADQRNALRERLVRIAAYTAELVRDDWAQSKRLGQTPLVRRERHLVRDGDGSADADRPGGQPLARPLAARADLRTAATGRVAAITESTLRAIAFPTFVGDLLKGTFDAIIGATIKQMEAFQALVADVSKSVEEFMRDNVSDNQARDYLVQAYPSLMRIEVEDEQPRLT